MASLLDPYTDTEKTNVTNGQPIDPTPGAPAAIPGIPGVQHLSMNPSLANYQQGQTQFAGEQLQQQGLQTQQRVAQQGRQAAAEIAAFTADPSNPKTGWFARAPEVQQHFISAYPDIAPQIPGMFNDAQSQAAGRPVGAKIGPDDIASGKVGPVDFSQLAPTATNDSDGNSVDPNTTNGLIQGFVRRQLPLSALPRGPQKNIILRGILAADPTFNPQDYEAQQKARDSFVGTGKNAQSILSANTLVAHLGQANDLVDAMGNSGSPGLNALTNPIGNAVGTQSSAARQQFTTAAHTAATEYAKMLSGGIPGEQEIRNYENLLSPNLSPQILKTNIQQMAHAMGERINGLQNEWNTSVKSQRDVPFLTPESRQTLTKLGINHAAVDPVGAEQAPQGQQPAAPQSQGAQPPQIPTVSGASPEERRQQWTALPSGSTYILNGQRYRKP